MKKREEGITLIALTITIVVLLILAGISIGSVVGSRNTIQESKETVSSAEKESLIEKIEADLYNEKIKTGTTPDKDKLKTLIEEKGYSSSVAENNFVSKTGNYTIEYSEIMGWK